MTEQRRGASAVIATSLLILACCALALTIKVFAGSPFEIDQPRVLEQRALEQYVVNSIYSASEPVTTDAVMCPASVVVEVGRTFDCDVQIGPVGMGGSTVTVEIMDDLGHLQASEH